MSAPAVVITLRNACATGQAQRFGQLTWTSLLVSGCRGSPGCTVSAFGIAIAYGLVWPRFNYGHLAEPRMWHSSRVELCCAATHTVGAPTFKPNASELVKQLANVALTDAPWQVSDVHAEKPL